MWSSQRQGLAGLVMPPKCPYQCGHWMSGQMNKATFLLIFCLVGVFLIVITTFLQHFFLSPVSFLSLVLQACSHLLSMFVGYCGCAVFSCFCSFPLSWVAPVSSGFILLFSLLFFASNFWWPYLFIFKMVVPKAPWKFWIPGWNLSVSRPPDVHDILAVTLRSDSYRTREL